MENHAATPSDAECSAIQRRTLTVPEAAIMLGVSRSTAYEMAAAGDIPTIRFGRRVVVPRKAFERMLEEGSK